MSSDSKDVSFEERIKAQLQQTEAQLSQEPFNVLVWGPNSASFAKRNQVAQALRAESFDAQLSEDLTDKDSAVALLDQERVHWSEADFVIALDFSTGPGIELATFCSEPEFILKTFVLYPESWEPGDFESVGSELLQAYVNRMPCTTAQVSRCDLVKTCVDRARAYRRLRTLT